MQGQSFAFGAQGGFWPHDHEAPQSSSAQESECTGPVELRGQIELTKKATVGPIELVGLIEPIELTGLIELVGPRGLIDLIDQIDPLDLLSVSN